MIKQLVMRLAWVFIIPAAFVSPPADAIDPPECVPNVPMTVGLENPTLLDTVWTVTRFVTSAHPPNHPKHWHLCEGDQLRLIQKEVEVDGLPKTIEMLVPGLSLKQRWQIDEELPLTRNAVSKKLCAVVELFHGASSQPKRHRVWFSRQIDTDDRVKLLIEYEPITPVGGCDDDMASHEGVAHAEF